MVNNIAFVLVTLNARLLLEDQFSMFESSLVRISAQDFISFALQCRCIVELTAYFRQVPLGTQFFMSVTHKLNSTGLKFDQIISSKSLKLLEVAASQEHPLRIEYKHLSLIIVLENKPRLEKNRPTLLEKARSY